MIYIFLPSDYFFHWINRFCEDTRSIVLAVKRYRLIPFSRLLSSTESRAVNLQQRTTKSTTFDLPSSCISINTYIVYFAWSYYTAIADVSCEPMSGMTSVLMSFPSCTFILKKLNYLNFCRVRSTIGLSANKIAWKPLFRLLIIMTIRLATKHFCNPTAFLYFVWLYASKTYWK